MEDTHDTTAVHDQLRLHRNDTNRIEAEVESVDFLCPLRANNHSKRGLDKTVHHAFAHVVEYSFEGRHQSALALSWVIRYGSFGAEN